MNKPPLYLWLICALISFSVILILNIYSKDIRRYFFSKPIGIAFDRVNEDSADIRVLILGSSYVREALSDPNVMSKQISKNDRNISYSFVKLIMGGAGLDDFVDNAYLFKKIERYDPHYILLQESTVFFYNEQKIEALGLRRDLSPRMIRTWLSGSRESYIRQQSNHSNTFINDSSQLATDIVLDRIVRPDVSMLKDFLDKIDAELILLHIPLPGQLESLKDSLRNTEDYVNNFKRIESKSDIHMFKYDKSMAFKNYYDQAHMNDMGEKEYTNWFLTKLHEFHLSKVNIQNN
ncbi:hypothetical protein [Ekhidna sp.]